MNKCQLVRRSAKMISQHSQNVKINLEKIPELAAKFQYTPFNEFEYHTIGEKTEESLMLLFVLDSLNFCFWPLDNFEYEHLATHINKAITNGLTLEQLTTIQESSLRDLIFGGIDLPLAKERARILREMASVVTGNFEGSFTLLIQSAKKSAVGLLNILTSHFPNFQDHSIYKGQQVHFYKRAQILIGDIWAKFQGKDIGQFSDVSELTMFADYRVPQILHHHGILQYSAALKESMLAKQQIESGSAIELQIRGCCVQAVEQMRGWLKKEGKECHSIEVDWFLWQEGENNLKIMEPHHRTLTIYY